jgi:hypothetical protein
MSFLEETKNTLVNFEIFLHQLIFFPFSVPCIPCKVLKAGLEPQTLHVEVCVLPLCYTTQWQTEALETNKNGKRYTKAPPPSFLA